MSDSIQASKVYTASAKVHELAKSMTAQDPGIQGAAGALGGLFSELVQRPLDKVRRSIDKSEELSLAVLQDSPHANPVAAAMATHEASHQVDLASEVLQKLMKLFDDMIKITL